MQPFPTGRAHREDGLPILPSVHTREKRQAIFRCADKSGRGQSLRRLSDTPEGDEWGFALPPRPPPFAGMQPPRPVARSRHGQSRCTQGKPGHSPYGVPALPTPSTAKHPSRCPWTTASSCPPPSTATSFLKILLFGKPGQPPLRGLKCCPGGAKNRPYLIWFVTYLTYLGVVVQNLGKKKPRDGCSRPGSWHP